MKREADHTQFGQRVADGEARHNLSDELGVVAQDVRVLFEDRRTGPRLNQAGARQSKMSADALFSAGKVASFRMQVSRTTRKVGPGTSQCPRTSLGFDERNRIPFGHRLSAVFAVCSRQRRGELEPDDMRASAELVSCSIRRNHKIRGDRLGRSRAGLYNRPSNLGAAGSSPAGRATCHCRRPPLDHRNEAWRIKTDESSGR